jgi:hypothetical protein
MCSTRYVENCSSDHETACEILSFEDMAKVWLRGKSFRTFNVFNTVVLWYIWKTRNVLCFQGARWSRLEVILGRCSRLTRSGRTLNNGEERQDGRLGTTRARSKKRKTTEARLEPRFRKCKIWWWRWESPLECSGSVLSVLWTMSRRETWTPECVEKDSPRLQRKRLNKYHTCSRVLLLK